MGNHYWKNLGFGVRFTGFIFATNYIFLNAHAMIFFKNAPFPTLYSTCMCNAWIVVKLCTLNTISEKNNASSQNHNIPNQNSFKEMNNSLMFLHVLVIAEHYQNLKKIIFEARIWFLWQGHPPQKYTFRHILFCNL